MATLRYIARLLIWVAKHATSHMLQSNKIIIIRVAVIAYQSQGIPFCYPSLHKLETFKMKKICPRMGLLSKGWDAWFQLNLNPQSTQHWMPFLLTHSKWSSMFFTKNNGSLPASFTFIFVFSIQEYINCANDWIRSADLWCRKWPLYQLRHSPQPLSMIRNVSNTETEFRHSLTGFESFVFSVTRLGEISPLGQTFWGLFFVWQNFEPHLEWSRFCRRRLPSPDQVGNRLLLHGRKIFSEARISVLNRLLADISRGLIFCLAKFWTYLWFFL